MSRPRHRRHHRTKDVKDRLIQTRVPERLESVLKEEATKRRLTVSHLIRNMLEDTFNLMDNVVAGAEDIAKDSVVLVEQVARDAGVIASTIRGAARDAGSVAASMKETVRSRSSGSASRKRAAAGHGGDDARPRRASGADAAKFAHILAWNQVVTNQAVGCASCGTPLERGSAAHLGLSMTPGTAPSWLCDGCLGHLKS